MKIFALSTNAFFTSMYFSLKKFYTFYVGSFNGLRKEVWWLALVTLINRAGTMVFPFLSVYLKEDLHFGYAEIGYILSAFGAGSVAGSWLGGKLTDRFSFYPIIFLSLITSGICFIILQYILTFWSLIISTFILLTIADTLRPAVYVAVNTYSKPENRTRSVTLIRLAINLGFSMGPAAGGIIISSLGYRGIFWIDGITCIFAGITFLVLLDRKDAALASSALKSGAYNSPYKDRIYLLFVFIVFLIASAFFQLFSTIPVYYREVYFLSERTIGILMAFNGLLIFFMEMPMIKYLENKSIGIFRIFIFSATLLGLSFLIFNISGWAGILVISMLFLTLGEMLNFPFLNRFALDRGHGASSGAYMALFTMAFSMGHIFGPNLGMQSVGKFGYETTWYIMAGVYLIVVVLIVVLTRLVKNEKKGESSKPEFSPT